MSRIKIKLPELYDHQQLITDHPARFKILCCGRRFGKTRVAIHMLTNHIINGNRTAYFAPTYGMTDEVWREMKRNLKDITRQTREHQRYLETITNGTLDVWTTTNETVRGRSYHFIVIDEAALIPTSEIWHAAIRPLLTDTRGSALFASTPRGRNWFHDLFNLGNEQTIHDYKSWQHPTGHNPFIDPAEIEETKKTLPARIFNQEYLAEFLTDGSAVFPNLNAVTSQPPTAPEPDRRYVFGIDWGRDNDFTAISIVDTATLTQVKIYRMNGITYLNQRERIIQLYRQYKPVTILAEENSIGTVNIEELRAAGLPICGFITTNKSKTHIIDHLTNLIETEQITLQNDETLIHEMHAYQLEKTHTGYTYNAPPGIHDDTVIATALSFYSATKNNTPSIQFV